MFQASRTPPRKKKFIDESLSSLRRLRMRAYLFLHLLATVAATSRKAYAVSDSTPLGFKLIEGPWPSSGVLASVSYDASLFNTTGWAVLSLTSNSTEQNLTLSSYAVGYLEGFITRAEIENNVFNTGADAKNTKALDNFLSSNLAWMQSQITTLASTDKYWAHLAAVLAQLDGMVSGLHAAGSTLTFHTIYQLILNGGDMFNLGGLYGLTQEQLTSIPKLARSANKKRTDHCSALVRLLPDNSDVFVSHTTWSGFESMSRSMKRYDMRMPDASGVGVPGQVTMLSGYSGFMSYSSDDFYVLSPSALVTLETTIDNDNKTLAREYASEKVVLEWLRNILANRLATSGPSWGAVFSRYASGTYTNSWMVLDSNLFTPSSPPSPNFLTVIEEMPGNIRVHDRTSALTGGGEDSSFWGKGIWASYNVPSDPFLFNISGQQKLVEEYGGVTGAGAFFSFLNTSRANIFRRDAPGITDLEGMRRVMRWNEFKTDPLSRLGCGINPPYSPSNAISDRSDLAQKKGDYKIPDLGHGDSAGIDAKITALSWLTKERVQAGDLSIYAQSGPTITQSCPVFSFSTAGVKVDHQGYPDVWDFPFIVFNSSSFV